MLPNVRLMFVAITATLAAIASGFGLFAAFRINHEPWSAYSKAGPSLELVAIHEMPDAPMPASQFSTRVESNVGHSGEPAGFDADAAARPVTVQSAVSKSVTGSAPPAAPPEPLASDVATVPTAEANDHAVLVPEAVTPLPQAASTPAAPVVADHDPATPPAVSASVEDDDHDASPSPLPVQASLSPSSSPEPVAASAKAPGTQHAVAKPRPKAVRRRVARRAKPQAAAGQPAYQWTTDGIAATRQADMLGASH